MNKNTNFILFILCIQLDFKRVVFLYGKLYKSFMNFSPLNYIILYTFLWICECKNIYNFIRSVVWMSRNVCVVILKNSFRSTFTILLLQRPCKQRYHTISSTSVTKHIFFQAVFFLSDKIDVSVNTYVINNSTTWKKFILNEIRTLMGLLLYWQINTVSLRLL